MKSLSWAVALCALLLSHIGSQAQTSIPGALQSYNDATRGVARTQQYYPVDGAFECVNGLNRFTRALYGSHTDWRLETSDRPVFAIVKKGGHRHLAFRVNGIALDSTQYCRARYSQGCRSYLLRDHRWGSEAELTLQVVACPDREGAVWRFDERGFSGDASFEASLCEIASPRLHRNGDIGADKPGVFEADKGLKGLQRYVWQSHTADTRPSALPHDEATSYFVVDSINRIATLTADEARQRFDEAVAYNRQLARTLTFSTPDPYINTLADALVFAADGDWDGQTWLHGCIGWRMPLAGWRAAYVGDVLGWHDRAVSHFDAYAKSQVTNVAPTIPHPSQDPAMAMARAEKRWGTQIYSDGYICRNPERNDQMHHYDMNLNYIDELLWHLQYDADTTRLRQLWPVIERHLKWEQRNFDPDGDHLYDAYCCIWASDALYYSGGAVTHSSAYNYRANRLAARIASILGIDGSTYQAESDAILKAMNERLWTVNHWAEYQEALGLRRLHESAAVWSVYTPIDCGACSPLQAWQATGYAAHELPRLPIEADSLALISTSDWMPYAWSINNVATAEIYHTALSFFQAGRSREAFRLLKANILDNMYYGQSPANFGQLSHFDAARGECYRDFGDCIGIASRAIVQGLFGIVPQALCGYCSLQPGFPAEWDSVSVSTPYLSYRYTREGDNARFEVTQNFRRPLRIVVRLHTGHGTFRTIEGTAQRHQVITVALPPAVSEEAETAIAHRTDHQPAQLPAPTTPAKRFKPIPLVRFNASVSDIFQQQYLHPRPAVTTLQLPVHGVGEWCHPNYKPVIDDSVFRSCIVKGTFTADGIPFATPAQGPNILFTSLFDNYPDSVSVPLRGKASQLHLLMAGTTNHMQSRIDNGLVIATYADGSSDTLRLRNPDNWCPIEQDYYIDHAAFDAPEPRPLRVCFGTATVSRDLGTALGINGVYGRELPGGAATILSMPVDLRKRLRTLTVRTLSPDVVIGLMAVTAEKVKK